MNLKNLPAKIIEYSFYGLIVIVPLILTPYNYELFEFNKMLTVYFFTIVITTSWIIHNLVNRRLVIAKTPLDLALILFLISQTISTVFSLDIHTSIWGYYSRFHGGLASTVCYLILFYAYTTFMAQKTRNTLKITITTALIVSLYAILEHWGIDQHVWVQDVKNRVFSTLGQPNWLAAYLLTVIPLTFIKLPGSKSSWLSLLIFFTALLFTKSRSGLLGLSIAYLIYWLLILLKNRIKNFPIKPFLLTTFFIFFLSALIGTPFTPSISGYLQSRRSPSTIKNLIIDDLGVPAAQQGGSKSSDIRRVVWQGALNIWKQYPLFGSGVETFGYAYYNFRPVEHNLLSEWDFLYNKAHNEFLNFLSTTGIFGLTSYCLIIISYLIFILKSFRHSDHYRLLASLLAGFSGLAVSNFFGFSVVPVALFFFLFPAISISLVKSPPLSTEFPQTKKYYSSAPRFLISLTVMAGLFALIQVINMWQTDRLFTLGRNYVKAGQINAGYDYLKQSVSLRPNEPLFRSELAEATSQIAYLYHQQTDNPEIASEAASLRDQFIAQAIDQSDLVLRQNKVHLNFYKSRAKIFFLLMQLDPQYRQNALETLLKTIELSPTDAKLYYNLSLLYSQMGQTGLAEQTLLQTIELKPNYEPARFALGSLYQQTNQPAKANIQFQYILDYINPDNSQAKQQLKSNI